MAAIKYLVLVLGVVLVIASTMAVSKHQTRRPTHLSDPPCDIHRPNCFGGR